jgi:hypothetical protein
MADYIPPALDWVREQVELYEIHREYFARKPLATRASDYEADGVW